MAVGVLDGLIIFAIIFGFFLGSTILFYTLTQFSSSLSNSDITDLVNAMITGWGYSDYIIVIFALGMFLLNFLTGFFKSSNPILIFLAILFQLFGIILAVNVQTIFDVFLQTSSVLTTFYSNLPFTLIIMQNVVLIYLLISSGYLIGLFAKRTVWQ